MGTFWRCGNIVNAVLRYRPCGFVAERFGRYILSRNLLSLISPLREVLKLMKITFLLIALTAGYFSHAQTSATRGGKVGYASISYIVSQLPEMKEIEADLKSTQTQLRNQLQARSQDLQKQYADFNANAGSMSDTTRENTQRKLEQGMADLEQMQQDARLSLENKQKLYMAPLYLKVNKAIQEVAVENGFEIILTDQVSGVNFLLFNTKDLDISDLVLLKFGVTAPAK